MIFEQLKVGPMENFCYILGDEESREGMVVDPHGELDRILTTVKGQALSVRYIVNTHTHWDHVAGNDVLRSRTGARVATHAAGTVDRDETLDHGDVLRLGNLAIRVLHTPGHSPDSICLLAEGKLLTGDTLFVGDCGRTDLPGGNPRALHQSLFQVLGGLEDEIEVFPGHDYGSRPSSTLGRERASNYTLAPRSPAEFIEFMATP